MLHTTIDFENAGKQQGFLQIPHSHNLGGWANVMIPITTIFNGQGPTVLVLGGNHGDEYQGQIAALKLARRLTPEMIAGRIILIPSLNFPAARSATRLSPIDGANLNREDYLLAPESGVFEAAVDLGTTIEKGEPIGYVHHLERPDRVPEPIIAQSSGYIITMRVPCLTQQGDCVAVVGQQVSIEEVMVS